MAEEEKTREFKGGGGGGRRMAGRPRPKVENPGLLFKRIMSYVFKYYGIQMVLVLVCIVLSVFANIQGTMFTRTLIDTYITPMIGQPDPDYAPLLGAMSRVVLFYAIGIAAAFTQQVTMVHVNQGTLKRLREDLFNHMESLPIQYFDTHSRGDIMSVYTNDIDTLRQMISQSVPQLFNSAITILSILSMKLILSNPLTLVTLVMVALMLFLTVKVRQNSGSNCVARARNIAAMDG